jgi:hypothetical protein
MAADPDPAQGSAAAGQQTDLQVDGSLQANQLAWRPGLTMPTR